MAMVQVELLRGRSIAEKQAIFDAIHDALVEAFKILEDDRVQRLVEYEPEDFDVPSPGFVIVTITVFQGRSLDAKRALYHRTVKKLGKLAIAASDINVVLVEVPPDNWGVRGGKPASEVDLGFDVNV
jgi:phenylpyruvate tautomerase PptA (4-oxalocrotonate tautomerase family)